MKHWTMALFSVASLSIAACGSSNSSVADVDLPDGFESVEGLVGSAESGSLDLATEEMMAGTASMSGVLGVGELGEDEDLELLGDLSMTADFTSGTYAGSADNFALYDESQAIEATLEGSLAVSGTISGTSIMGFADGTLTDDEDHEVLLDMDGSFYDYEGDLAAYGDTEGTIDGEYVEGGFAAIED
jgi:hypothetical protein